LEKYKYRAVSDKGRLVRGILTATSEIDLSNQLQSAGLETISCSLVDSKKRFSIGRIGGQIKLRDIIQFFLHMEQMQGAGVPLLDSLADVRDTTDNERLRDIMTEVHRAVSDGSSLSEAMARHPKVFNNLYISLIKAGEDTGDLTASYRQLLVYLKWVAHMQGKIKKATRYPMIVLGVVLITIVIMMGFVVPEIIDFIKNMKMDLPFYTVALISTSEFFQSCWWVVIGVPIAFFVGIKITCRVSDDFAYKVDSIILQLPLIGNLIRKVTIARYAQTFGALFAAGIDIISALRSARQTVNNMVMLDALERVERYVQAGQPLSEAFNTSGEFPSMVIRMLSVGEESGNLTTVLDQVSEFYSKDVDEAVEAMITAIEPALTVILGGIILWIAAGVFGPIYNSFSNMEF
jgi:type IV pilus assembly protein PilC